MTATVSNNWNIVVGIFLLILAVSGNFVAETISCQSQKLLYNNMLAKNVIILMVIYFSLGFASSESIVNPLTLAGNSVLVWLFFLIFNKMDIQYTIISIVGMFAILVMKDFVDYYVEIKENENMVPILHRLKRKMRQIILKNIINRYKYFFIIYSIVMDKDERIKELEEELQTTKQELQTTKEHLKKYTAPSSRKEYYEKNKEVIKERVKKCREKKTYKSTPEQRKEYNRISYLRRKEKQKKEMEEKQNTENI